MSGVIVNNGAFCWEATGCNDEDDTALNGVKNDFGSKFSSEEFGRYSASRTIEDSSNKGDRGRIVGYPKDEHLDGD